MDPVLMFGFSLPEKGVVAFSYAAVIGNPCLLQGSNVDV
jgi:hypothetical protein